MNTILEAPRTDSDLGVGRVVCAIARSAIGGTLGIAHAADDSAPWLRETRACFVTLRMQGDLRGCIGTVDAHRSLLEDLRHNAIGAAFHDPRFAPLTSYEYARVSVEVSLLSPTEAFPVVSEADLVRRLRPSVDGVVLQEGTRRATFLPQVWDVLPHPAEFVRELKRKAGFPGGYWSPDIEVARYTVAKYAEVRAWTQ